VQLLALGALVSLAYAGYVWRLRHVVESHRERIAVLRQLLDSIRVINSTLDLPSVLEKIAAEGARLVDGEPGGIGLVQDGHVVFSRLWSNGEWAHLGHQVHVGQGVAG